MGKFEFGDLVKSRANTDKHKGVVVANGSNQYFVIVRWEHETGGVSQEHVESLVLIPLKQDLISDIQEWFKAAVPNPSRENQSVQMGCHFEEMHEFLEVIARGSTLSCILKRYADNFKNCESLNVKQIEFIDDSKSKRTALLDAIADQIVTLIGVAHTLGMDIHGALAEVSRSNWSKFEDGKPVFNEQGKIKKGVNYTPPQLEQFINHGTNQIQEAC